MAHKEVVVFSPVDSVQIHINFDAIPEYQRNELAKFALEVTRKCFAQPGEEERYQAWLAERNSKRRGDKISEERRFQ